MIVVSSITCSSLIHLMLLSLTNASTPSVGPFWASAISIVSVLSTNSQRPSVATTKNLSVVGSRSNSVNSGSEMTPAVCATASPRDLLKYHIVALWRTRCTESGVGRRERKEWDACLFSRTKKSWLAMPTHPIYLFETKLTLTWPNLAHPCDPTRHVVVHQFHHRTRQQRRGLRKQ